MNKNIIILNAVTDLVADLLYYDRKEDEDLGVGDIEHEILTGNITLDDIVKTFKQEIVNILNE